MDKLLREHVEGKANHEFRLWIFLNLELWHRCTSKKILWGRCIGRSTGCWRSQLKTRSTGRNARAGFSGLGGGYGRETEITEMSRRFAGSRRKVLR
mgnify:CR=1 FL=1